MGLSTLTVDKTQEIFNGDLSFKVSPNYKALRCQGKYMVPSDILQNTSF